ncbi:AP2 domain-containing protein [Sphingomonas sp. AOB5]|uniref:AP2 domain-containing protein n=1 Tax=Sphingomonas sp. AOB5 TaxID=3034017 RepID=UPI0023F67155|nr:AP2 domain-containing protein [Sphingomonas sp. AOB5]MDF7775798.1 AP2 domain-containing protein [Sphingomonas sp. AOB5]
MSIAIYEPSSSVSRGRLRRRLKSAPAKTNRLGITGVLLQPSGRYRARLTINGRIYSLGSYATAEQASDARKLAQKALKGPLAFLIAN